MADRKRSSGGGGLVHLRLVVVVVSLPCMILLPFWVYDTHRGINEPGWLALAGAVAGMMGSIVILEGGLRCSGELWREEMRRQPVPKPDPVALFRWAVVISTQLVGLGMFMMTMDGGLRWAAARWAYLGYAAPALALAVARWGRWALPERLFLRWGWAPVLAFGVPLALPRLLAAGLITDRLR